MIHKHCPGILTIINIIITLQYLGVGAVSDAGNFGAVKQLLTFSDVGMYPLVKNSCLNIAVRLGRSLG